MVAKILPIPNLLQFACEGALDSGVRCLGIIRNAALTAG